MKRGQGGVKKTQSGQTLNCRCMADQNKEVGKLVHKKAHDNSVGKTKKTKDFKIRKKKGVEETLVNHWVPSRPFPKFKGKGTTPWIGTGQAKKGGKGMRTCQKHRDRGYETP